MASILTNEQKQLAFRLRARGWGLAEIAREVGCTAPMVGLMIRDGRFTTGDSLSAIARQSPDSTLLPAGPRSVGR